jgi:hypothetical protein
MGNWSRPLNAHSERKSLRPAWRVARGIASLGAPRQGLAYAIGAATAIAAFRVPLSRGVPLQLYIEKDCRTVVALIFCQVSTINKMALKRPTSSR